MRKILKRYPGSAAFNFSSLVTTAAQESVSNFFQQRLRWAAKWRFNSSVTARMLALLILCTQLFSLYAIYRIMRGDVFFIFLMGLKITAEVFVLISFCIFLRIRVRWPAFLFLIISYPFYVITIGFLSFFLTYSWKGRKYDKA
jgi:poly-beta-1,6-N-acetyl-D-glucosamine synthase